MIHARKHYGGNENLKISGLTRFVPLLAHPAKHVRTPGVFNENCGTRGIDMVMVPLDVHPVELQGTVASLRKVANLAGFVITIPHKTVMASLCDDLTGAARLLGVCNVVRRDADGKLTGGMFDGEGFVAGLRNSGLNVKGRDALLLGAGGAASGIAHALASHGVSSLTIANRSMDKAEHLAKLLQPHFPTQKISAEQPDATHADLVINGTSLGMHEGDPLPLDVTCLKPGTIVAEAVMQPDVTPLLKAAADRGCIVHKGIHMVQQQVQLLVDFLKEEARAV